MTDDELIAEARAARDLAYAPYSRFHVGAALLARDGRVFRGCNVEDAAYGLCNCAERTAFFCAIAAGVAVCNFERLAVIGDTPGPISPCGACRQVMIELGGPQLAVLLCSVAGQRQTTTAAELLPGSFSPSHMNENLP